MNDETGETDPEVIATLLTVCMLADVSNKTPEKVAEDVLRYRTKNGV